MKAFLLIAITLILGSCKEHKNTPVVHKEVSVSQTNDLKVGGLYISKNKDNTFNVSKILALDDFAVHLRIYSDTLTTKPVDINSGNLKILIGHAPLDISGFLLDKPELLKVEEVKESELEGYKIYLEAMQK